MEAKFKLTGLSRLNNESYMAATIEPFNVEESVQAKLSGTKEQKEAMWNYCENDWSDKKVAIVECDYVTDDGIPINPTVISIELL